MLWLLTVTADHEEQSRLTNNDNDAQPATNVYLTVSRQDSGEKSSTAIVDSRYWNDIDDDVDMVNSAEQSRSQMSDTSRRYVDRTRLTSLHHSQTGDIVSSQQSSALKLKCKGEPPREETATGHSPISPSNSISPSTLAQSSLTVSAQEHKLSHSAANHMALAKNRRTLLNSNEPLGSEFDVKQIKVHRGASNSTSSGEVDLFADMEPVITLSSAQQSLLGLLSAAASETTVESTAELTSRLNISSNHNHIDSAVSCDH